MFSKKLIFPRGCQQTKNSLIYLKSFSTQSSIPSSHNGNSSTTHRRRRAKLDFLSKSKLRSAAEREARQKWRKNPKSKNLFTKKQKTAMFIIGSVLIFNVGEEVYEIIQNPAKFKRDLKEFL